MLIFLCYPLCNEGETEQMPRMDMASAFELPVNAVNAWSAKTQPPAAISCLKQTVGVTESNRPANTPLARDNLRPQGTRIGRPAVHPIKIGRAP